MATRWGCVGAGNICHDFFLAMKSQLPASDHQRVAIAARDLERAQKFAEKFEFQKAYGSYEELASDKDVEVVYIGTMHTTHVPLCKMMLNAGKHVVCEIPMALNYKDAKEVLDLAREKKLFFLEAEWSNFLPTYKQIRKELASGSLGDIHLVEANLGLELDHAQSRNLQLGGGALADLGICCVNAAFIVYGGQPESITAVGQMAPEGVDVAHSIVLKYRDGGLANLYTSSIVNSDNTMRIVGTKGQIVVHKPFFAPTKVEAPSGVYQFEVASGSYKYLNSGALCYEAEAVREALLKGKTECEEMTLRHSEIIHEILDEVKRQLGLKYPEGC